MIVALLPPAFCRPSLSPRLDSWSQDIRTFPAEDARCPGSPSFSVSCVALCCLQKSQVLYNQANTRSFAKTPGWGYPSVHGANAPSRNSFICRNDSLLLGVPKQDGVGLHMPALDSEFAPVRRKTKSLHLFGAEMRELPGGRAVQRLLPKIIYALFSYHVHHSFRVWGEGQGR